MPEIFRITRKELLEQVWSVPLIHLAPKYGLSDSGLRKRCKTLKIPLPPQGYWQGKKYQRVSPPALPAYDGPDEIEFKVKEDPLKDYPVDLEHLNLAEDQIAFERTEENKIEVIPTLHGAHPLISQSRDILNDWFQLTRHRFTRLERTRHKNCLDITVSKNLLKRALCIMNTLLKELEKRGFPVSIGNNPSYSRFYPETRVKVLGVNVAFGLREPVFQRRRELSLQEKKKRGWLRDSETEYILSGKLRLDIKEWESPRKNWLEGKTRKLEDCLNDFIIGLVQAAVVKHARELRREENEKRWEEERKHREALRRQMEEERARVRELWKEAESFDRIRKLRNYIEAVRAQALKEQGSIPPDSRTAQWLAWAEDQADRLDPLKENPASMREAADSSFSEKEFSTPDDFEV